MNFLKLNHEKRFLLDYFIAWQYHISHGPWIEYLILRYHIASCNEPKYHMQCLIRKKNRTPWYCGYLKSEFWRLYRAGREVGFGDWGSQKKNSGAGLTKKVKIFYLRKFFYFWGGTDGNPNFRGYLGPEPTLRSRPGLLTTCPVLSGRGRNIGVAMAPLAPSNYLPGTGYPLTTTRSATIETMRVRFFFHQTNKQILKYKRYLIQYYYLSNFCLYRVPTRDRPKIRFGRTFWQWLVSSFSGKECTNFITFRTFESSHFSWFLKTFF